MKEKNAQRAGFEPARGDPIRFQVELLNHSDIAAAARKSARRVNKNDNEKSSLHPGCAMSVVSSQCLVLGVKTLGLILIYYVFSITLTFYNRWMSKVRQRLKNLRFHCLLHDPDVRNTTVHDNRSSRIEIRSRLVDSMVLQVLARNAARLASLVHVRSQRCTNRQAEKQNRKGDALIFISPAIMSALDIGISNWGLEFITTAL